MTTPSLFFKTILLTFLLVMTGLIPAPSHAATCACYFGEHSSCVELFVEDGQPEVICRGACLQQFGTDLGSIDYEPEADPEMAFECAQARAKAASAQVATTETREPELVFAKPVLNIDIPTVSFSEPKEVNGAVESSVLGEYISGLYQYLIVIATTMAIVMVMIGGFQYTVGAANQEQLAKGKKRIKNGVTGLILLLLTYVILFSVNPQLLRTGVITLPVVDTVDLGALNDAGDISMSGTLVCGSAQECEQWCGAHPDPTLWPTSNDKTIDPSQAQSIPTVPGLRGRSANVRATSEMIDALKRAGQAAVKKDPQYMITVTSGYRPLKNQISLVCNRFNIDDEKKRAKAVAAIGSAVAFPGGSNHGSGNAVDIMLTKNGAPVTTGSFDTTEQNDPKWKEGASILAEIMAEADMVRYSKEIWHFELEGKGGSGCRCKGTACPFPASC